MRMLEEEEMQPIRVMMYFWSVMYYFILFGLSFTFKQQYCGGLFYEPLYVCYGTYAILNGIWEVYLVMRIQNKILEIFNRDETRAKKLLDFNRWHVVELFMGQIARLDTFLDFIFIVIIINCPELNWWLIISGFYMSTKLLWDIGILIKMAKLEASFEHTMPYMESNNYLSFLRENMLLGTVLPSLGMTIRILQRANGLDYRGAHSVATIAPAQHHISCILLL